MTRWEELKRLPGGAVPMLLFWFGGAAVLTSLIVGAQMIAVDNARASVERWMFFIPGWGVVALGLALVLRFWRRDFVIRVVATIWLAIAIITMLWGRYA